MKRFYNSVDRNNAIAIPVPMRTKSYSPVSNDKLITNIEKKLENKGIFVNSEEFTLSNKDNVCHGRFLLNKGSSELGWSIGFENSYDKSRCLSLFVGAEVLVCSNGMVRSKDDVVYVRRHRGIEDGEIEDIIDTSIDKLSTTFEEIEEDVEKMKNVSLSKKDVASYIGQMFITKDIIYPHQLSALKKEVTSANPIWDGNTAWDFYNKCTQAIKRSAAKDMLENHLNIHSFFEEEILS